MILANEELVQSDKTWAKSCGFFWVSVNEQNVVLSQSNIVKVDEKAQTSCMYYSYCVCKPCAECFVNLCGFWPPGDNKMVSSTYVVQHTLSRYLLQYFTSRA